MEYCLVRSLAIKYIYFDLDDTLLDFSLAQEKAFEHVVSVNGLSFNSSRLTKFRQINLQLWKKFELGQMSKAQVLVQRFDQVFAGDQIAMGAVECNEHFLKHLQDFPILIKNALEVCQTLSHSYQLGIIIQEFPSYEPYPSCPS